MKAPYRLALWSLALVVVTGCASTEITDRETYQGEKLARPDRIIVHDFTADPAEVPADSAFAGEFAGVAAPSPEEAELGRRLGAAVAERLVADLQEMGLPAVQAAGQPPPQVNDILIKGYFVAVDEGSAGKRLLLGFGAGAAELQTAVEGFQMTAAGLRPLGHGHVESGGGKMPGMALPVAVLAATANPIGLVVGGAAKLTSAVTGSDKIDAAAERTADEIAAQLRVTAEKQGWI